MSNPKTVKIMYNIIGVGTTQKKTIKKLLKNGAKILEKELPKLSKPNLAMSNYEKVSLCIYSLHQ